MPHIKHLHSRLEALYERRNRREFVDPDPLQCVYRYSHPQDIEIAGLIAAGLAYGRVAQIMRNVNAVFDVFGSSPRKWLEGRTSNQIARAFDGFQHRWTTDAELAALLRNLVRAIGDHGSLESLFLRQPHSHEETVVPALTHFCNELRGASPNSLVPDPAKNAACKRLHLFLRWMVRGDEVDLGCWNRVDPARLVVPLDTHMHQIAQRLNFTNRKQAGLATALEITQAFRSISPSDPVKYDFVLTRFGIRSELTLAHLDAELSADRDHAITPAV